VSPAGGRSAHIGIVAQRPTLQTSSCPTRTSGHHLRRWNSIGDRLRGKKLENLDPQLRKVAGFAFYNTSRYDFDKLLADAPHLAANLRNYIAGFSPNMREVLESTKRRHHARRSRHFVLGDGDSSTSAVVANR